MKRRELERLLDQLVIEVPAAIRRAGLKPNACILASRLGVEALRSRGVRARPLSVGLRVLNPVYQRLMAVEMERGEELGTTEEWRKAGAWSVVLGHGVDEPRPNGWDGHLVVVVAERYLLDLTASQVKRLKHSIDARAFWYEAPHLVKGEREAFRSDDGCIWLYEPRPADRDFLSKPAWSGYRVRARGSQVVSERHGPMPELSVAPTVTVRLRKADELERRLR